MEKYLCKVHNNVQIVLKMGSIYIFLNFNTKMDVSVSVSDVPMLQIVCFPPPQLKRSVVNVDGNRSTG